LLNKSVVEILGSLVDGKYLVGLLYNGLELGERMNAAKPVHQELLYARVEYLAPLPDWERSFQLEPSGRVRCVLCPAKVLWRGHNANDHKDSGRHQQRMSWWKWHSERHQQAPPQQWQQQQQAPPQQWQQQPPQQQPQQQPPPQQPQHGGLHTLEDRAAANELRRFLPGEAAVLAVADDVFAAADLACAALRPLSEYPQSMDDLVSLARVFRLALMLERDAGRYQLLESRISDQGQRALEVIVWAPVSPGKTPEDWPAKTIGDVLQRHFEKCHALRQGYAQHELLSGYNKMQSAFARWLNLPELICADAKTAADVAWWAEHPMADLNEAFTLFLPGRLLDAYMCLQAHFKRLTETDRDAPKCSYVDATLGICYKNAVPSRPQCSGVPGRPLCSGHQ